ncbi:hypothetical protein [Allosphingosinicella deserti]|nr:hypothetical protein [Sphingomonas deserti]
MSSRLQTAAAPTASGMARAIPHRNKPPQDTSAGCFTLAEADRARATGMNTAHGRDKYSSSAAAWTSRAELLARLETGSARTMGVLECA